jgi:hypothetical protein
MTRVGLQYNSKTKTASTECISINCITVCLAYSIRIWCSDCAVRNTLLPFITFKFWSILCLWNTKEFTCFIFYPATVTRTWTRNHEFYNPLFHVIVMLQINTHPLSSWSALSPTHRSKPTAIIIIITVSQHTDETPLQWSSFSPSTPYHKYIRLYHHHHHQYHQQQRISINLTISKTVITTFSSSSLSLPLNPPPSLPPWSSFFMLYFFLICTHTF